MNRSNLRDNRENVSKSPGLSSSNSTGSPNNKEYNSIPLSRFYTENSFITLFLILIYVKVTRVSLFLYKSFELCKQ